MNTLDQDLARTMMELRLAAARQRQLAHLAKASRLPVDEQDRRRGAASLRRLLAVVQRVARPLAPTDPARIRSRLTSVPQADRGCSFSTTNAARAVAAQLADLLDTAACSIVERGTLTERRLLEIMSDATGQRGPGAAAALVDWSGSETARLRAYGIVHGHVLALAPREQRLVLARIQGGATALPLAG